MRTTNQKELTALTETQFDWSTASSGPVQHRSYHEMSDTPVVELDAMTQLENNVILLESMQNRLSFMMREVREVLKV